MDEKKLLGAGRSSMKNNDSDWALHSKLQAMKKYKNSEGIELNLNSDSTSLLLKEIIKESIILLDNKDYDKLKAFLMKNFDLNIGDIK